MKPASFDYHAPNSIEEVVTLKSQYGDAAKFLAGGQSLVPAMNFRIVQPSVLIDLNRAAELSYIREDGNVIRIGSMARERHLEFDATIEKRTPLLHEAVPNIAHPQIRNRGTIGGSIVNADPAAELPVLMLALNARLKAKNKSGERWLDAKDFFAGMFTTALEPDEVLVEIELPFMPPRTGVRPFPRRACRAAFRARARLWQVQGTAARPLSRPRGSPLAWSGMSGRANAWSLPSRAASIRLCCFTCCMIFLAIMVSNCQLFM